MTDKRPPSFHDLVAMFSDHTKEDRDNFDGMKRAFSGVEAQLRAVDTKQDEQIDVLKTLLRQAEASAEERGRRVEREAQERRKEERNERWLKWVRYAVIPIVAVLSHLVTRYVLH